MVDFAAGRGVDISELVMGRPTAGGWQIAKAQFTVGSNVEITARNLGIAYSMESLRRQRIDALDVEDLRVSIVDRQGAAGEPFMMPDLWRLVPIDTVMVDVLEIVNGPLGASGRLRFDTEALVMQGNASYKDGERRESARFHASLGRSGEIRARFEARNRVAEMTLMGDVVDDRLNVDKGDFEVELGPEGGLGSLRTLGSFTASMNLNAPRESLEVLSEAQVELRIEEPPRLALSGNATVAVAADVVELTAGGFTLKADPLELAGQQVRLDQVRLELEQLTFSAPELRVEGRLRPHLFAAPISFAVDADPFAQSGSFRLSLERSAGGALLKDMLPGWKSDYDLDGGALAAEITGEFAAVGDDLDIAAAGVISVEGGVGHYDKVIFRGLVLTAPVFYKGGRFRLDPAAFSVDELDAGLPVTDIRGTVSGTADTVMLTDFNAGVLGGRASVAELSVRLDPMATRFQLGLEAISLAELLALEGEEVLGNGTLDGFLPVEISDGAVLVNGGSLKARSPGGHIAYRGNMPATSPGLDLAIRALRDFDFETLEAEADMAADGDLKLLVRLHGSSPDVENGRPIHFNVNVTENIPILLESLRASQAMTDRVQRRLSRPE